MKKLLYKFKAEVWLYPGQTGNWHFVSFPKKDSENIKKEYGAESKGWGSLPVLVTLGKTTWSTSIFPDKKSETYMLPLKADVRKKEAVSVGKIISLSIQIQ